MSFLLKILKGANAGAEIALVEGTVTFGSGEGCDIVLADATLADAAFALETTAESVTFRPLPDGEAKVLEPYTVFASGEMEFAIGEEGAKWPKLKRPEPPKEEPAPAAEPTAAPQETPSAPSAPPAEREKPKRRVGCGCLLFVILLLIVFFVGGYLAALRFGEDYATPVKSAARETWRQVCVWTDRALIACRVEDPPPPPEPPKESLDDFLRETGLIMTETNGVRTLNGNFAKRVRRLDAAARARAIDPDFRLDLSDDETLRAGAEETLFMLTGGKVTVASAANRVLRLAGRAKTHQALLDVVSALCADVRPLKTVDDTAVVCEDGLASRKPTDYRALSGEPAHPFATKPTKAGLPQPKCPVAGIIVTPYPCLVLRDGSRATEGAEIGGWTVVKISADEVTLRQGGHEVVWRP